MIMPNAKQRPIRIGTHLLGNPVILAPMSGVTDSVFRRMAVRLGADLAVSEMIASNCLVRGEEESRLRMEGADMPVHIVQLAGRDPYWLAEAARLAEGAGAQVIDLNMGCPAKKVTGGACGSALLRDLDLATRLIDATVKAVTVPVTVKMRLGWDEHSIVAPELAQRAEQVGAQLLTVHGRTRQQFYDGDADWVAIRNVKNNTKLPVIANGDVKNCEGASMLLLQSGADGVMIGRGAQGKPWLPGHIAHFLRTGERRAEPDLETQHVLALEHYDGLLSFYGEKAGIRHARKHLGWYLEAAAETTGGTLASPLRHAVMTAASAKEAIHALNAAYATLNWKAAA
jgi:tRNA-dihydrouridine synthase B